MGYGFVAEDMAAICLVLLEGDARRPTTDLLRAIDAYQEKMGQPFGTTPQDMASALFCIAWSYDLIKRGETKATYEELLTMPFYSLIPLILKNCEAVYFNDGLDDPWDYYRGESTPSWRRARLLSCFSGDPSPEEVQELLLEIDWNEEMLELFLLHGGEDWKRFVYLDDRPVQKLR